MADLVIQPEFQHILRMLNTNIDGRTSVQYALTAIPGIGRRFSNLICKKADIDLSKRAGELTSEEVERLIAIISNPLQFKIPVWYLNRRKDIKTGRDELYQTVCRRIARGFGAYEKMRLHRGLRHYWGIRVRGQHTKTTGRNSKAVGMH